MWLAILILIGLLVLCGVWYGFTKDDYDDGVAPTTISVFAALALIGVFIAMPITKAQDERTVLRYTEQAYQLEQTMDNIDEFDSSFMKSLYYSVYRHNQDVVERRYQVGVWWNSGHYSDKWNEIPLLDISKLPKSATINAIINGEQ